MRKIQNLKQGDEKLYAISKAEYLRERIRFERGRYVTEEQNGFGGFAASTSEYGRGRKAFLFHN